MIKDIEILNEIKEIRDKTELLSNPLYNDAGGSVFWSDIDNKLKKIEEDIEKNLKLWNIM